MARRAFVALHFAFFVTGAVTAMIGVLLPRLSQIHHLSYSESGLLFAAQFGASVFGVLVAGYRKHFSARAGVALCAIGAAGVLLPAKATLFAAFALCGLGCGLAIPAINLVVAEESGSSARALNLLNFLWGAGAFLCATFGTEASASQLAGGIAISATVGALMLLVVRVAPRASAPRESDASSRWPSLVMFGWMLFCYVGAETAFAGWIGAYHSLNAGVAAASSATAAFWAGLLLGRVAFSLPFANHLAPQRVLRAGVLCGAAAMVIGGTLRQSLVITAVAAFCMGPVFAAIVAMLNRKLDRDPRASWPFVASSIGAAAVPAALGTLAERASLQVAMFLPAALLVLTIAPLFALALRTQKAAIDFY
jgi:fucose permease